ncbi:site-specific integrase [Leeuwenhoekiella marinoflava]|uniref:Site-specific recombinase XerD n=2 Tax=Leeuwenhoekiella marinoflava TaxID=988 RepID=A0A4Q0P4I0_9FLAO|nr:site-specific integrase [Leeuwenhoekiella marinoflava]RXG21255.1 site-specific recombinase XerD [Leeuwenhoekiella marinoflava]SHG04766.1 Site-specific recombinase XerD [Leeuwenhoekiella marinoflava DSM 3653]
MVIKLKKKKLTSGKYSLYIEYYKGKTRDANGKQIHSREFEYLKQYLYMSPKNALEKRENEETLLRAEQILSIRRAEYAQGKYGIKDRSKDKLLFLNYYEKLKEERYETKGNYDSWDAAQNHLENYCKNKHVTFEDVDEEFVLGYKKYLNKKAKTKSNTLLSQNSKYSYFNKFKAALRQAFDDGYTSRNYATAVKGFAMGETMREYLTHEELQNLVKAECKHQMLKNAFIFSCLTGLRWSDINKLTWSEVRDEEDGSRLIFQQKKTAAQEYQYLSEQARSILGTRKQDSGRVFQGLKYGAHFNAELLRWCMRAGITKHITFHSARHTHAVLLLENGADIYTVSKILGHKEIRTTQIYAKIVDKKKKEAAYLIPKLEI